ncbi:MAG: glycosyltransferase family 2 protein, partial [Caldilineaceae bacterium]|nr:glycosyltransferase family 2 protein [Caldilineaceae bacterium]
MSEQSTANSAQPTLTVSVIATVYNEGENMRRLLNSLAAQTRLPDEIIICDGGSRDNTVAIIREYVENG